MESGQVSAEPLSITQFFNELCPQLMAYGQSREEFWHGDPAISNDYIKAHELRRKERNEWLALEYRYNFISSARAISIAMSEDAKRLMPEIENMAYIEHPIPLNDEQAEFYKKELERVKYERMKNKLRDKTKK